MRSVRPYVFKLCLALALALQPVVASAGTGRVFTLWPLLDYRSSPEDDFVSVGMLGPLLKFESNRNTSRVAIRPLYYHQESRDGTQAEDDFLYPVATRLRDGEQSSFQLIHLLNFDSGPHATGRSSEFSLFPLVFYGHEPDSSHYFALFPLGGRIRNFFGRDSVDFALFPLYSRTSKKATVTTNILWPVFSVSRGPQTSGWQFWPFYGDLETTGVSRKRFVAWPFYLANDRALNTVEPLHQRLSFPLFEIDSSPSLHAQTFLWPFFSHTDDEISGYEEWDFPWPFFRRTVGERRHGVRIFPLYTDETVGTSRKRLFLWPLYKIEEGHTATFSSRRDRILYFLYSDLEERVLDEPLPRKKRVALWPFFTYESREGASSFATLALLEPFYPENDRIARNLAPLWHIYQTRWDRQGNEVSSFLWNLYWKERRGDDLALELFPLFAYSRSAQDGKDLRLLKGLLRYQRTQEQTSLKFLFLPWGISWENRQAVGSE